MRIVYKIIGLCLLVFVFDNAASQGVQWASSLEFQYNCFAKTGPWSGAQVVGPPDAMPFGSLNESAARLISKSAYATVKLRYNQPQQVEEILVMESFEPGRVAKIVLYDAEGKEYTVYEQTPGNPGVSYRALVIPIDKTDFKVAQLAIHVNSIGAEGWSQIDAVGISSSEIPDSFIKELTKDENTLIAEEIVFSTKREELGQNINTQYSETKPVISPDGNVLYFVRQDYPYNTGGKRDPQDIYYSDYVAGKWRLAKNIDEPLNDGDPNGICSISPDGNTILVINAYNEAGVQVGSGVSMAQKTGSGWTTPLQVDIDNFSNKSPYEDYYLSNSGTALLMAIESEPTHGEQDLYVSFRQEDGSFAAPVNLGPVVNSSGNEFSPFLASDNQTLYFSSDGLGGHGESDIFYTRRLDNSWTNWSTPVNIGDEINTPGWDAYYTMPASGDFAYFVSSGEDAGSSRNTDIFSISLKKDVKPDPVVLLTGVVYDKKTNQPIEAEIAYESYPVKDESGIARSNPTNGAFKLVLPAGQKYVFAAQAKGYISVNDNADYTAVDEYVERKKDLYLVPIEKGQVVQLNNIFFEQSKAEMLPESESELERLYQLMENNPGMEIKLRGHTDNRGYYKSNLELSQKRADAVMEYLIDRGVSRSRLSAKGYGPTMPVATNNTPEGRAQNRRVEIEVTEFD